MSTVAILLAVVSIVLIVYTVKESEKLTDGVLALMGICATFVVGVSFIDSLTVYRIERKVEKLEISREQFKKMRKQANILFHYSWGLAYISTQPYSAISEFWEGFLRAVKAEDASRAYSCICNAETVISDVIEKSNLKNFDKNGIEKLPTELPEEIKRSKLYDIFEEKVNSVIRFSKQQKQ